MRIIKRIIRLLTKGECKFLIQGIIKRINSENLAIGFKRDLKDDFQSLNALIELKIRLAKESDHLHFSEENTNYGLFEKNIKSCYIATDKDDIPCFRIWLMEASQNDKIQSFFNGYFPILKKDEALIEIAFTISSYRGKGIMPAAMSRISEKGIDFGARYILAFVDITNSPSLKGFRRAGFHPCSLRTEKWFLFNKKISFMDISPEYIEKYNSITCS